MNFTNRALAGGPSSQQFGTTDWHLFGTIAETSDGRMYRWVKAGLVDLVPGNVLQGPAIVPDHLAMTPAAMAVGAVSGVVALGATAATANQYAEGWMQVDTTPGNGYSYRVTGHAAAALSTNLTLNFDISDPIAVALTTGSRVGLIANPCSGVIQFPVTTATGLVVGVAVSAIPAGQFGWVQFRGPCPVLIAGTPALGATVMTPSTTAGTAVILTTTNLVVAQVVGTMMQVGVSGKNNMVNLTIA